MIARFFVGQVVPADVDKVVGVPPLKLVAEADVQKRVAGRRCFEFSGAILTVYPLAFDARRPMFAFVVERRAVTQRRDARQWLACLRVLGVNVVALQPQIEVVRIFLVRRFTPSDNALNRFGIGLLGDPGDGERQ